MPGTMLHSEVVRLLRDVAMEIGVSALALDTSGEKSEDTVMVVEPWLPKSPDTTKNKINFKYICHTIEEKSNNK